MVVKQTLRQLDALIRSDLYRETGSTRRRDIPGTIARKPGFAVVFSYRIARFWHLRGRSGPGRVHRLVTAWRGCELHPQAKVGPGLRIDHTWGLVVHEDAVLGRNATLAHQVTVGQKPSGVPVLGDGVYLAPGAKVVGGIRLGDGVAVGANAVVTRDLPDGAVAVGVPARVIGRDGAGAYVTRVDYDLPDLPGPEAW